MHIAIIMDGNGRWAINRHLNRQAGHRAGAKTTAAIVRCAAGLGVKTLTLYAFSADNWLRPVAEVEALFGLLRGYLVAETNRCRSESVRINVIGRRDRLSSSLTEQIELSERLTSASSGLHLRLAIDYSSRYSIAEAARRRTVCSHEHSAYLSALSGVDHSDPVAPEVDLLIRTGGEKRLSDFLLWECAYAELLFLDCLWPDFDAARFLTAIEEYSSRERRFGRLRDAEQAQVALSCR
jgi:undecaprenyl diphosphate synthase